MNEEKDIVKDFLEEYPSVIPDNHKKVKRHKDFLKTLNNNKYWYIYKQTEVLLHNYNLVQQLLKTGKLIFKNIEYTVVQNHCKIYSNLVITYKGYTVYAIYHYYDGGSITFEGDCNIKEFSHYPSPHNRKWLKRQSAKVIRRYHPIDEDGVEILPVAYSNKIYKDFAI